MKKEENEQFDWTREEDVSVEEVLASEEFKHLSMEQAKEVVEFVRTVSTIFYSLYKKQYESETDFETKEKNNNNEPLKNAA